MKHLVTIGAIVIACSVPPRHVGAQGAVLRGQLDVDPARGTLAMDACLSGGAFRNQAQIVLHQGLNVQWFRAGADGPVLDHTGFHEGRWVGEGHAYTVAIPDSLGTIPSLCVAYTGAYPVYRDNSAALDYKGRIAFLTGTVRATEQSKWYPIVYDSATDQLTQETAYDLQVNCAGCRSIYLSGSEPQRGPTARLRSSAPVPLLIFAGDFEFVRAGNLTFIGGQAGDRAARAFGAAVAGVSRAFEEFIGVPYRGSPAFLTFRSIGRNRQLDRTTWGFMTWPTIAFDGSANFDSLVAEGPDGPDIGNLWEGLAHEMAHYYFGTVMVPAGPLRWFLGESLAEYTALYATRELRGEARYQVRVQALRRGAQQAGTIVPLNAVERAEQVGSVYRYMVGPLFLVALESRVGVERMGAALRELLTVSPPRPLEYADVVAAFSRAGITSDDIAWWEAECLAKPVAEGCISAIR